MVARDPLSEMTMRPPTVSGLIWFTALSALNILVPPWIETSGPVTPSGGVFALKARVLAGISGRP